VTFDPAQLESALRRAEALPDPAAREAAREIARDLLAFHRAGLTHLVDIVRGQGQAGAQMLKMAAAEESTAALLALHDLSPAPEPAFVPLERVGRRGVAEPCAACELCGFPVADGHAHLLGLQTRQLACACQACAVLFDSDGARYRRVRPRAQRLALEISEPRWSALGVPVALAFFRRGYPDGTVIAAYPGPAGATQSEVDPAAWQALIRDHPVLGDLEPEVEALLVNRLDRPAAHWRVSIDHCYRLAGLVRRGWHGVSGGDGIVQEVSRFFQLLPEAGS
jgi:hypothetical protein